ncbi:amidase [Ramlibacter albus]|uniref:Amidase n=1 Tax=Ramlibacter albus TaxID=2079448 RepID=A0A923MCK5_9BURK|nr:amidase [Ramlibacter albus]MBC5768210.1 amidase [Ramlibacter albus]
MDKTEIPWLTATELLEHYRRGTLSPVEVTRTVVERAERSQPLLNAFCVIDPEAALASARESEARWRRGQPLGLLDGVPVSIKDIVLTKGWPTLRGSRTIPANQPWEEDAPSVARLREHGAVLFGKTTTPEFAVGPVTRSPLTGVTRNPWNVDMTPGGSSGGAGAAVAAGIGPLALGTDAGGSIRIPSSFCGIFGHKPSGGRVPTWPPTPYATFAAFGPMTRTVEDAARMLTVVSGPDPRDWNALPYDPVPYHERLDARPLEGMRIAWSPTLGYARVDDEVRQMCEQATRAFTELGAKVETVAQVFENPMALISGLREAATNFAFQSFGEDKLAVMDERVANMIRETRKKAATASDYLAVEAERMKFGARMNAFHRDYPLLLTPTVAVPPFSADVWYPAGYEGDREWWPFTIPFNFTRQPASSVPCGFTKSGLPVGLHIVGPAHADLLVLQASRAFERVRPWRDARPRVLD